MFEINSLASNSGQFNDYKSIDKARAAFGSRDVEASRAEHLKKLHDEPHSGGAADFIKSIVFGGLDGIMTTFAIIAAAAGSRTHFTTILIFGFSNVVADGFAMGFGEFVSGNAEIDYILSERRREEWEIENSKDLEIEEMVELYQAKGLSESDARTMVQILAKDDKIFADFMMVDELGLTAEAPDSDEPIKQGLVMFLSFVLFGSVPLLAYMFAWRGRGVDGVFCAACAMTAAALLSLGAIKGYLSGVNIFRAAAFMLVTGIISGLMSFLISMGVESFVGQSSGLSF